MTFDELVSEVHLITNRPDLVNETKSAIKAATLKGHKSDFYSKDIFEAGIEFAASDYTQSLDYINIMANFRAFKYVRRVDSAADNMGKFFEIITPEESLDSYGANRTDIAYVAGRVLEIKSAVMFKYALVGAYVLPIVREGVYRSWIAEQCPHFIVYEAARIIFRSIGQIEESNAYSQLMAEELQLLRQTALADVGS